MAHVYIGVGANIDAERNVREALRRLSQAVRITGVSTFYRTEAMGAVMPAFVNGVIAAKTDLPPCLLKFAHLRRIEHELGRVRGADRYAARPIDLDLLLFDDLILRAPGLHLPDPDIVARPFLAIPLCELAPDLRLPGSIEALGEIAARMPGPLQPLSLYSQSIKEELFANLYRQGRPSSVAP